MLKKILISIFLTYFSYATIFKLDKANTNVDFSLKNTQANIINGGFKDIDADIVFSNGLFLVFNFSIDANSVFANNKNDYLKLKEFFNTKENPKITFVMNKYTAQNATSGILSGELKIKAFTKQINFIISDLVSMKKDFKTLLAFNIALITDKTTQNIKDDFVFIDEIKAKILAKER